MSKIYIIGDALFDDITPDEVLEILNRLDRKKSNKKSNKNNRNKTWWKGDLIIVKSYKDNIATTY